MSSHPLLAVIVLAATACTARPTVSPRVRTYAVVRYAEGATTEQLARELAVSFDDARSIIHTAIVDLNRRYFRRE